MPHPDRSTLQVIHHYQAPPEPVFDAFLDPAIARRFLFATPDGEMVKAEIDPRVGGRFTFVDRRSGIGEVEHVGEYLEIDRPRRLVFTFGVTAYSAELSTVRIEIAPEDGDCRLTLTQTDILPEYAERSRQGWSRILESLPAER